MFFAVAFWPLGQLYTTLAAWVLIPSLGWRAFVVACALPPLLAAFMRPLIPESPRWLLMKGRQEEATAVLRLIAETNGDRTAEEVGLGDGVQIQLTNEVSNLIDSSDNPSYFAEVTKLFSGNLWRTTVGVGFYVSGLNVVSYGIQTFMPSFLEMKGLSMGSLYETATWNALAGFPGALGAGVLAIIIGRLPLMHLSLLCISACMFLFSHAFNPTMITIYSCIANAFLESGWAVFNVYVPEAFPTELRATASGALAAAGTLVSMVPPFISAFFVERQQQWLAIISFAAFALFTSLITWLSLDIETKDRDLQDSVGCGTEGHKCP